MAMIRHLSKAARYYSESAVRNKHTCKLLIVGAGTGGCSVAWRIARRMREYDVIVLEPSPIHYNQAVFPLVAAGIKQFSEAYKPTSTALPSCIGWLQDHAEDFDPCNNTVYTRCGDKIVYDYLVIALGLQNDYEQIPGLQQGLDSTNPVTTIYCPKHCKKTWSLLKQFKGGHAVFAHVHRSGGKCPSASQNIMYLADDYWRKHKIRQNASITYATGASCMFGVPKYATALSEVAANRDIAVDFKSELVEVTPNAAVFRNGNGGSFTIPYNFLHVAPATRPPVCLTKCEELVTGQGYLDVHRQTLQHSQFQNIFGIGDCLCTPNGKTASAISCQSYVVLRNLVAIMEGREPITLYNGYESSPVLTSYKTGILAESLYDQEICETFPFDQSKERRFFYHMQNRIIPFVYWERLIKGKFKGPSTLRKIINPLKY